MMKCFYPKLAIDGIRKNKRLYLPYILTCSGMSMMFYIIYSLSQMPTLDDMPGGSFTKEMLGFGAWVIALFSLIFLTYTNSFLMRRRKKEFGLYNILGMDKKNLSTVYALETVILFAVSMLFGLIGGIAFSKLAELGLVRMMGAVASYDFTVNVHVILRSLAVFGAIFVFLLVKGLLSLWHLRAVSLIKSENVGEKPPRANYLLGILGILILGEAYYIAVSIQNPVSAVTWFFVAVIMVILATYMLFVAGSVMMCRLLQKNKKYYYKKEHFVSVSSMAYRMKRNGGGLASICILSTMVLVMILSTGSLFFGVEDSLKARYPTDVSVSVDFVDYEENKTYSPEKVQQMLSEIQEIIGEYGSDVSIKDNYISTSVAGILSDGKLIVDPVLAEESLLTSMDSVAQIYLLPLSDYNASMGTEETLENDEILICCMRRSYDDPTITLPDGTVLKIKKHTDSMMRSPRAAMDIMPSVFLVVNDIEDITERINKTFSDENYFSRIRYFVGIDTHLTPKENIALAESLREHIRELDYTGKGGFYSYGVEGREAERDEFYATFGGLFYLGIILSVVFIIAAILIIYYKQVTEGYEDESRFAIMRKVGMTKQDIKTSVNSQMLTVFFLPLIAAAMHLCFAFPLIQKLLLLFNLTNTVLMIVVLVLCILVFAVLYTAIYKITSSAYYKIVSGRHDET